MKITFLIGNGFDLNLGLKTTYKDFYKNYLSTLDSKSINNNILYRYIDKNIEDWVDFETRLGLFTFPPNSSDSGRVNLLKQAKSLSDDNDFIENELNNNINFSSDVFLSALTDFRKSFKKYLIQESKRLDNVNRLLGAVLYKGLTSFSDDYNDNEKISIYSNMNNQATFSNAARKLSIDYSFLTFNYTEFLELGKIYIDSNEVSQQISKNFNDEADTDLEIITSIGQVYHIHSKLNGGMFLGVDNDSQLNSEVFSAKELSILIKPLSNQIHNNNITDRADKEIASSNIIVIYGTALGVTDLTWWKKIITFLQNRESHMVLIHKFDLEIDTEEDDFFALEEMKEDVKEHLLSFDDKLTVEETIELKKQIFVNLNSKSIFNSTVLNQYLLE
ncbi:AbiH family protein [Trichococcus collinsii]|uniref:Bacteriophage abortive infection AbiH n=1 Tax=Trichococcus collinsii TaxID=157076 RepID=A0AB37ZX71_9LACT|nr:AbiH family protein [Trichococcus collinsii]CZQ80462.1 bacteriophage abortive infection abih [Trichococcus collinsii]SDZ92664.1 Bacteriophage abortive infection AbiH [Trichococcus collinsii]